MFASNVASKNVSIFLLIFDKKLSTKSKNLPTSMAGIFICAISTHPEDIDRTFIPMDYFTHKRVIAILSDRFVTLSDHFVILSDHFVILSYSEESKILHSVQDDGHSVQENGHFVQYDISRCLCEYKKCGSF